MGMSIDSTDPVAQRLVTLLTAAGRTVATAESLTGGMVVAALVSVPGASSVVRGGVVAYMTDLKESLLGVDRDLLAREGAVHPEVACEMALGARDRLGADYGLATTGVAGPDPQDGRGVGEVHVAVAGPDGLVEVRTCHLDPGLGRAGIRAASVGAVLGLLLELVDPSAAPSAR
jgi:nicotinamide-nucleotide amidase